VTLLWCSGLRLVARLLDRRAGDRAREEPTVVRHPASGWSLRFESEPAARQFLDRYCCEPAAFAVTVAADEDVRPTAA
jgi:hypothetical protein